MEVDYPRASGYHCSSRLCLSPEKKFLSSRISFSARAPLPYALCNEFLEKFDLVNVARSADHAANYCDSLGNLRSEAPAVETFKNAIRSLLPASRRFSSFGV